MTSTDTTEPAAGRDAAKATARLRSASMGLLTMLVIQFALGVGVNLYITPAKGGVSEAFSNGPLLALHSVLGLLLIIAAVDLMIRAILTRHRAVVVASAIGLIAILGAAFNGIGFLKNGRTGPSLGMALAACVAMLCYGLCLRVLGTPGRPEA